MADYETDRILITAEGKTENAVQALDNLISKVNLINKGGKSQRLEKLSKDLDTLTASLKTPEMTKLSELSAGLAELSAVPKLDNLKKVPDLIVNLGTAADLIKDVDFSKFSEMALGLASLGELDNYDFKGMRSALNGMRGKNAAKEAEAKDKGTTAVAGGMETIAEVGSAVSQTSGAFAKIEAIAANLFSKIKAGASDAFGKFGAFAKTKALGAMVMIGNLAIKPFQKIGEAVKGLREKVAGFFAMFKKRAMYRFINAILTAIRDGFKTGVNDVYEYSKAVGTSLAPSLDKISTSFLYLKNSIGAMVAPLINAVAPAIDFIIDKCVDLLNVINQVFATLTGATTWTKALKYPKAWADNTKKASGAAKELKKTILGIDEINPLNGNSGSGGSGGAAGENYAAMFEEQIVDIDNPLNDFFKPFKDAWDKEGKATIEAMKTAWEEIKSLVSEVAADASKVWSRDGEGVLISALHIWQNISKIVGGVASKVKEAWTANDNGERSLTAILGIVGDLLDTLDKITLSTADWVSKLDLTKLGGSITGFLEGLRGLFSGVESLFANVWDTVLLPLAGWVIEDGVPASVDALTSALGFLESVVDEVDEGFDELWEGLDPLCTWLEDTFAGVVDTLKVKFEELGNAVGKGDGLAGVFEGLGGTLKGLLDILKPVLDIVTGSLTDFFGAFLTMASMDFSSLTNMLSGLFEILQGIFTLDTPKLAEGIIDFAMGGITFLINKVEDLLVLARGFAGALGLDKIVEGLDWVIEKFEWLKDQLFDAAKIASDVFLHPMSEGISELKDEIGEGFKQAWETIKEFFGSKETWETLWNNIKTWFSEKFTGPIGKLLGKLWGDNSKDAEESAKKTKKAFKGSDSWFDKNVTKPIGQSFSTLWDNSSKDANTSWSDTKKTYNSSASWMEKTVTKPMTTAFSTMWKGTSKDADTAWTDTKTTYTSADSWMNTNVTSKLTTRFNTLWNTDFKKVSTDALSDVKSEYGKLDGWTGTNVTTPLKTRFNTSWNTDFKGVGVTALGNLEGDYKKLDGWMKDTVSEPLRKKFDTMWNTDFKKTGSDAWDAVKRTFGGVATFFESTFRTAWNKVKSVFSWGGDIFVSIKDAITDAFKWLANQVIKGLNNVIKTPFNGLNTVIRKLRQIKILGKYPFSWINELSVPTIPYLAEGGVINGGGQVFVAREAGAELVGSYGNKTAVMNNDQIVQSVTDGVAMANSAQNALLREQNELLRDLLRKESNVKAYVTTSDIVDGMLSYNKRTGRQVIAVNA